MAQGGSVCAPDVPTWDAGNTRPAHLQRRRARRTAAGARRAPPMAAPGPVHALAQSQAGGRGSMPRQSASGCVETTAAAPSVEDHAPHLVKRAHSRRRRPQQLPTAAAVPAECTTAGGCHPGTTMAGSAGQGVGEVGRTVQRRRLTELGGARIPSHPRASAPAHCPGAVPPAAPLPTRAPAACSGWQHGGSVGRCCAGAPAPSVQPTDARERKTGRSSASYGGGAGCRSSPLLPLTTRRAARRRGKS